MESNDADVAVTDDRTGLSDLSPEGSVNQIESVSAVSSRTNGGRKRICTSYVWEHTRIYDNIRDHTRHKEQRQCRICKKWFSTKTNASGWKKHLYSHGIQDPAEISLQDNAIADQPGSLQTQLYTAPLPKEQEVLDNAVVDYILESMTPHLQANKLPLSNLLSTFRPGYKIISARTVGRRLVELYAIMIPLLTKFIEDLPVRYTMCIDGWTNWHQTVRIDISLVSLMWICL